MIELTKGGTMKDDSICIWDRTTLPRDKDPWYIPRCNRKTFFYVPPEGSPHHFTFCPYCGRPYELRPKAK